MQKPIERIKIEERTACFKLKNHAKCKQGSGREQEQNGSFQKVEGGENWDCLSGTDRISKITSGPPAKP
jgi:hypothetical protein